MNDNCQFLVFLVKLESLDWFDGGEVLMFVIQLVGEMEVLVFMVGLIDKDVEFKCLDKELECLQKEIGCLEGKLGNEKFIVKVLVEVVEKEQDKFWDVQSSLI